ncbi:hypothetical protein HWV62_32309 [Athelia sp. TMB]|nr:hypothetical protein HWV62_32309 [Athelia sp. TMB]
MDSESSDILGGPSLEIGPSGGNGWFYNTSVVIFVVGLVWLVWFGRTRYQQMTEIRYKKAMRRRHGIPDEDLRPFNVAYAAAVRAKGREDESSSAPGTSDKRLRNALAEGQEGLRQRFSDVGNHELTLAKRPAACAAANHTKPFSKSSLPNVRKIRPYFHILTGAEFDLFSATQADPLDFDARYKPIYPELLVTEPDNDPTYAGPIIVSRQPSRQSHLPTHIRKRSFDEAEDEIEPMKKSRVEGEDFIDGDEDAAWAYSRGAKRGVTDDDDEGYESNRGDKRARNASRDKTPEDHVMEDEEVDADELADLRTISRGKKRDRAEAGSTFGGDDEEDQVEEGKASRRRKRKMLSKRKSEAHAQSRGQKRDMEESDEDETGQGHRGVGRKRGKKAEDDAGEASDVSMNESLVSRGSYIKGRRIGEEWEVNGVLYKVGPNRQRLRQALVKRARNKFPMPKDSQHPDSQANLEVFVETWLTEEEYKEAKERHELAWQDTPKPSAEPETPGDVQDSSSVKGKNLLWSTAAPQESPLPARRPFRQSIATNVGLRINAFPETQTSSGRRISSAYSPVPPGVAVESPSSRKTSFRTFSKWEKQDLEAEAMAKMRAKLQEQKKLLPSDAKSIGLGAPPLTSSLSAPGFVTGSAPSSSFANPGNKLSPAPSAPSISLSVPNSTGSKETSKPSLFSAPSAPSESKTQPSFSFGNPAAASTNSTSSLSFPAMPAPQIIPAKPSSTPTPSLSVPNFFAKGTSSPAPAATAMPAPTVTPAHPSQSAALTAAFGVKPPVSVTTSSSSFSFGNPASKPAPPVSTEPTQSLTFGGPPASTTTNTTGNFSLATGAGPFGAKTSAISNTAGSFNPPSKDIANPFGAASSTTPVDSPFSSLDKGKPEASKTTSVFGSSNTANGASVKPPSVFGSSQPTSVFGSSVTTSTPPIAPSVAPVFGSSSSQAANPTPPKFSFGVSKAPSASTTPAPETPKEDHKPQASGFSFAPAVAKPTEPTETASAPKFKFNVPGGASPAFGSTSGATSTLAATPALKGGFGGFSSSNGSSVGNPFGAASTTKSPLAFGSNGSTAPTSDKSSEAPRPSFSFGGSTAPAAAAPASAAPSSNATPSFSFSGGASPFGATGASNTNGATQSAFGKTSTPTPSAFGFGNTSTSFNFGGSK